MIYNRRVSIFDCVKWLITKYVELEKKTLPHPCKITSIHKKNNKCFIKIQFSGSLNEIEFPVSQIIKHDLFEFFSAEDKKKIFFIAHGNTKLKISDFYFCPVQKETMVILIDEEGNRKTSPVKFTAVDNNFIDQLHPKDANIIGFLAGLEYSQNYLKVSEEDATKSKRELPI